jgi:DNA repair ATPase RecN
LNEEEHIHEVARLMSGEEISDAAILNAKNLMNS